MVDAVSYNDLSVNERYAYDQLRSGVLPGFDVTAGEEPAWAAKAVAERLRRGPERHEWDLWNGIGSLVARGVLSSPVDRDGRLLADGIKQLQPVTRPLVEIHVEGEG